MNNRLEKTKFEPAENELAPKIFGFAALGVMAAMLALMNFHMTIIIFLVLVGYFVWRAVARTEIGEVRGIFEFYHQANDLLRDDERRWYGFEIQDVIYKGQRILGMMPDPPPLVHFALGALHHRAGNFQQAENHFAFLLEDDRADERSRTMASHELKSYVKILRKLEREPAEAPQTTAAIRALERARRHRAAALLAESRQKSQELLTAAKTKEIAAAKPSAPIKPLLERLAEPKPEAETAASAEPENATASPVAPNGSVAPHVNSHNNGATNSQPKSNEPAANGSASNSNHNQPKKPSQPQTANKDKVQKSISEVLRDIYD